MDLRVLLLFLCVLKLCSMMTFVKDDVVRLQKHIETEIEKFADDLLKFSSLENDYINLTTSSKTVKQDGKDILSEMVQSFRKRLKKAEQIVKNNKYAIETKLYQTGTLKRQSKPCCVETSENLTFSQMFNENIIEEMCYLQPKGGKGHPYHEITEHFKQNIRDLDVLLWQYFGSSDGSYLQYPIEQNKTCNSETNHHFEKWFVNTASPQRKNMVIIIDESGSMSMTTGGPNRTDTPRRIDVAKEAANTVLDTLGPTDYVGIVAFNNTARIPSECLGAKVVPANEHNKERLRQFISTIDPEGSTYYGEAFSVAFKLLSTAKNKNPDQFDGSLDLVLFLTDGKPTDPNASIFDVILKGQEQMNHTVHVLVYGLGQGIQHDIRNIGKFLLQLADQNNRILSYTGSNQVLAGANLQWKGLSSATFNQSCPVGPPGNVTFIADADGARLKGIMGKYYTEFPLRKRDEITISLPRVKGDVGLVLTLSTSTRDKQSNFHGVTAVDLPIDLTFYEAVHYKDNEHSYAFVTGEGGVVLYHPMLRRAKYDRHPILRTIGELERELSIETIKDITSGVLGTCRVQKEYLDHFGQTVLTQASVHYTPVPGFEGTFSIGLVIFDFEKQKVPQNMSALGPVPELLSQILDYHCIEQLNMQACAADGGIVFPHNITTTFVAKNETQFNKTCFEGKSFNDTSSLAEYYSVSLRAAADAYLTRNMEAEWQTDDDFIWRYLGTENGMLKVYPGTIISYPYYDPRHDEWYTKALRQRGRFVFLEFNKTVTVAKAFNLARSSQIAGVMAADITSHHMKIFFANILKSWTESHPGVLLDNRGFIVGYTGLSTVGDVVSNEGHLTNALPVIADRLIKDGFMKIQWCVDLLNGDKRLSYGLALNSSEEFIYNNSSDKCQNYVLIPVTNTNLYMLLYQGTNHCPSRQSITACTCQDNCVHCSTHMQACQCPCSCSEKTCSHNSTFQDVKTPCTGSGRHWRSLTRKKATWSHKADNLTECPKPCTYLLSQTSCESVPGCSWCRTGYFKHYPICSQHCIVDKIDVEYSSPCRKLSGLNNQTLRNALDGLHKTILDMVDSTDVNLTVTFPKIEYNATIRIAIETEDMSSLHHNVIKEVLSSPIILTGNGTDQLLVVPHQSLKFTQMTVILHLHGINFTSELRHALTLRSHVKRLIHSFIWDNFPVDVVKTLDNIWPYEGVVSFTLDVPRGQNSTTVLSSVESLKQEIKTSQLTFDLLGTKATISNMSYSPSYENVCKTPCGNFISRQDCFMTGKCEWDIVAHQCNPYTTLPERASVSVYFPCMGLYKKLSDQEIRKITKDIKNEIRKMLPRVSREAIQSVAYKQVAVDIGSRVDLTLQGVAGDPDVAQTLLLLQQKMSGNFTVQTSNSTYRGYPTPTKYREFTDIQITLTVKDIDFEELLRQYPITARQEVLHSVRDLVHSYFLRSVAKSLTHVLFYKSTLQFTLYKTRENNADLRSNYEVWRESVEQGHANITVFGSTYTIYKTGFVGSFYQICPRHCNHGLSRGECINTPGCYWSSDTYLCSDDMLLPERVSVPVVVECSSLSSLTNDKLNKTILDFKRSVSKHLTDLFNISVNSVHSFGLEQLYPDSLMFTIQGTVRGPPLSVIYQEVNTWIADGGLTVIINSIPMKTSSIAQHSSLHVGVEYPNIHFMSDMNSTSRRQQRHDLHKQIQNILPLHGYTVTGFTFSETFLNFTVNIPKNRKYNLSLKSIAQRLKTFSDIGGLGIVRNDVKHSPANLTAVEKFTYNCTTINCSKISTGKECNMLENCVWITHPHKAHKCVDDQDLSKRLELQLFVPCNLSQTLSPTEKQETESALLTHFEDILNLNSSNVIRNVKVTEGFTCDQQLRSSSHSRSGTYQMWKTGVSVGFQATYQYPLIEEYADNLLSATDYRTGFSIGPKSTPNILSFRSSKDFTNTEISLKFDGIDFNVLRYKFSNADLEDALHKRLNVILLGETALSVHVTKISREWIVFSMTKDKSSHLDMNKEISHLKTCVNQRKFVLAIPFIRPIMATDIFIVGTFKKLCPEKYQDFSIPPFHSSTFLVTTDTNISIQTTTVIYPRSSLILVYNQSEVSQSQLKTIVDRSLWDVCYVKLLDCPACLTEFSQTSCSFSPVEEVHSTPIDTVIPNVLPVPLDGETQDDGINVGPVAATCIAVSCVFLLALLIWAAQWMHQVWKNNANQSKNKGSNPNSSGGRSIELLPTN